MKSLRYLILAIIAAALAAPACEHMEAVSRVGTTLGVAGGYIDQSEAESINRSAVAVARTFQDITPEQEYYIGRAVGAVVLDKYQPYPDKKINDYVNLLGQTLAMASDRPETFAGYHFLVLDSEEINAFAAPSGHIFVTRGMLRCCKSEAALAAVLAHEIGHVQHKHGLQAIKKSRITAALTSVALTAAEVAGPQDVAELTDIFDESITDITSTLINNGYSREFEREADRAAVAILTRVGYDPGALVSMLGVMDERLEPGGPGFAKTHPDPGDRIAEIEPGPKAGEEGPVPEVRQQRFKTAMAGV